MGCGPGVCVPQALVEGEVVAGMQSLVRQCSDTRGFTRQVNEELRHLWEATDGDHATAQKTLRAVESRIANIRKAVEEGLADVAWANQRMGELMAERASLGAVGPNRRPPQLDVKTAMEYRRQLDSVLADGDPAERKRLVRMWVDGIEFDPAERAAKVRYRVPEVVVNGVVPGDRLELNGAASTDYRVLPPPSEGGIPCAVRRGRRRPNRGWQVLYGALVYTNTVIQRPQRAPPPAAPCPPVCPGGDSRR
jgi:hypothetical protein